MNFYHISLLLLVVLSTHSEGPQHAKPPEPLDSSVATVCPESTKHDVVHVLPQNGVPQNEVYTMPQIEVYVHVLPQNGVLKSVTANCQLPCHLKNILDFVLNVQVKGCKIWTWFCYAVWKSQVLVSKMLWKALSRL